MRLRPSGTQGPVATSLASFKNYQTTEAWTWEHLALTRARPISGDAVLMEEVETFRREILARPRDYAGVRNDVTEMRARIAAAKTPDGPWDAKIGAGRLQDIELISQTGALLGGHARRVVAEGLQAGVAIDWLGAAEAAELAAVYRLCWQVQLASKLLSGSTIVPETIGAGGRAFLLRETGHEDIEGLLADMGAGAVRAAEIITAALGQTRGAADKEA
jgi:glutamate-ammonia-ligase adenylyltransferase